MVKLAMLSWSRIKPELDKLRASVHKSVTPLEFSFVFPLFRAYPGGLDAAIYRCTM
jgi:hypothetical protein